MTLATNKFPEILAIFGKDWELLELSQIYKICNILVGCGYTNATESIDTMLKIVYLIKDMGLIELDNHHSGKLQAKLTYYGK